MRRLYDIAVGSIAIVVGAGGVFIPHTTSRVVELAFPGVLGMVMFAGLLLAGLAVMLGTTVLKRVESPAIASGGLFTSAGFFLAYAVGGIGSLGLSVFTGMVPYMVLFIVNLVRIFEISRGAREARAAVIKRD